jgi:hypothetical protein
MTRIMIGLLLGVAALAACSKPASNEANAASNVAAAAPAAAPVAAAPAATPGPITLADLPAPTAGLWTRVSSGDGGANTDTKCMDGKPINPMEGLPGACAKMDAMRTATGGFTLNGDCPNNGVDAKLTMAAEGDFSKHFTTDSTMTMTGGPGGAMTVKNHSDYTYTGKACDKPATAG